MLKENFLSFLDVSSFLAFFFSSLSQWKNWLIFSVQSLDPNFSYFRGNFISQNPILFLTLSHVILTSPDLKIKTNIHMPTSSSVMYHLFPFSSFFFFISSLFKTTFLFKKKKKKSRADKLFALVCPNFSLWY